MVDTSFPKILGWAWKLKVLLLAVTTDYCFLWSESLSSFIFKNTFSKCSNSNNHGFVYQLFFQVKVSLKKESPRNSLAVQWLRFCASTERGSGWSLVKELKSHKVQEKAQLTLLTTQTIAHIEFFLKRTIERGHATAVLSHTCPSHFLTQHVKKMSAQMLRFNKINNFYFFIKDTSCETSDFFLTASVWWWRMQWILG